MSNTLTFRTYTDGTRTSVDKSDIDKESLDYWGRDHLTKLVNDEVDKIHAAGSKTIAITRVKQESRGRAFYLVVSGQHDVAGKGMIDFEKDVFVHAD